MSSRLEDWLIRLAIVTIGVVGIFTIWGEGIRRLFADDPLPAAEGQSLSPAAEPPGAARTGPAPTGNVAGSL